MEIQISITHNKTMPTLKNVFLLSSVSSGGLYSYCYSTLLCEL